MSLSDATLAEPEPATPPTGDQPVPVASTWDEALAQTERWLELCATAYAPGPPPSLPHEPLPERLVARADALLGRLHGAESVLLARREELRRRLQASSARDYRREVWA